MGVYETRVKLGNEKMVMRAKVEEEGWHWGGIEGKEYAKLKKLCFYDSFLSLAGMGKLITRSITCMK